MSYFNFSALIKKYETTFTVISSSDGYYDDLGEYQQGAITETQKKGAIIGLSDTKMYRSEGALTAKDKELYMNESLGCDFDKAHVAFNGNKYKVESQPNDNHNYTGVWSYTLKWISAFDGGVETA